VTSPRDWPASLQIEQLDLQLDLLRKWAKSKRGGPARPVSGNNLKEA
jgi:hypothetical protein